MYDPWQAFIGQEGKHSDVIFLYIIQWTSNYLPCANQPPNQPNVP